MRIVFAVLFPIMFFVMFALLMMWQVGGKQNQPIAVDVTELLRILTSLRFLILVGVFEFLLFFRR